MLYSDWLASGPYIFRIWTGVPDVVYLARNFALKTEKIFEVEHWISCPFESLNGFCLYMWPNNNNLLTESEGCTGKCQTEVLLYWRRFDIFRYSPEQSESDELSSEYMHE